MEDILRELSTPSTPASVIIRRFSSIEAIDGKFSRQVALKKTKTTKKFSVFKRINNNRSVCTSASNDP